MKTSLLYLLLTVLPVTSYGGNYIVTNTNASGPGSFDEALGNANANPGYDTISFAITGMPHPMASIQISEKVSKLEFITRKSQA